jgi:hypothetical protein
MKVWSRGLGKQALSTNWFKTDVKLDGKTLIAEGIVRDKGIIWDCKFTFTEDDLPGILHMLLSGPLMKLMGRNIIAIFPSTYNRIIRRQAGKGKGKSKGKS